MLPGTIRLTLWGSASSTMETANIPSTHGGSLASSPVLLDLAVPRGAFWKAYLRFLPCSAWSRFMGLASTFFAIPTPRRNIPYNRLGVVVH